MGRRAAGRDFGRQHIAVISISYGNPEDDPSGAWTAAGVQTVNQAFQAAIAAGITICCASGDDGSGDGSAKRSPLRLPRLEPLRARGRRHEARRLGRLASCDPVGGRLERGRARRRRGRRRRLVALHQARVAGSGERAGIRQSAAPGRPRRARRRSRRRPGDGGRRHAHRRQASRADRRHERLDAALGVADRLPQPGPQRALRVPQSGALREGRERRPEDITSGNNGDVFGRPRMGRLHRPRHAERGEPPGNALTSPAAARAVAPAGAARAKVREHA